MDVDVPANSDDLPAISFADASLVRIHSSHDQQLAKQLRDTTPAPLASQQTSQSFSVISSGPGKISSLRLQRSNSVEMADQKSEQKTRKKGTGTTPRGNTSKTGGRTTPSQKRVARSNQPTAPSPNVDGDGDAGKGIGVIRTDSEEASDLVGMDPDVFDRNEFLDPDFPSFKAFIERPSNAAWIREPDSKTNIIEWADHKELVLPAWVLRPNAESDRDMMRAINGHDRGFESNVTINLGGHTVEKGEIMFLRNNTQWEARGEGRYRWWSHYISVLPGRKNLNDTLITMKPHCPILVVMILPGKIGIAKLDMKPVLLLPGRHAFNNPLFEFNQADIYDITSPVIQAYTIKLINIKPNQVGFATHNNQYYLLKPGLHFSSDPAFTHMVTYNISGDSESGKLVTVAYGTYHLLDEQKDSKNQAFIQVGTITLAQVHPSEYGCVYIEDAPKLLRPGFYARNSPSFNFERTYVSSDEYIRFGTLHILNIRKGRIALITNRNKPHMVEGPAIIKDNSYLFEFVRTEPADVSKIVHRSITRYRIETGFIGFAQRKGIVEKLDPGIQTVDDPDFIFVGTFEEKTPLIRQGQYTLITVQDGHLVPVWENGVLEMIKPGFKLYQSPNIFVGPIVDLYPPIISFKKIDAFTRDRSQMQISGQLEYVVEDAHLLVTSIGADEMISSLELRICAILRHHLAITDLSSISSDQRGVAPSGIQSFVPKKRAATPTPDGSAANQGTAEETPDFRDELSEQGTKELQADATRWGLRVIKMEVSDIHYKDDSVESAIADRTTQTRIAESDYDLSIVRNRQTIVEVEAAARKEYIEAESKANQELLRKRGDVTTFKIENDIILSKKKTKVEADKLAVLGNAKAKAAEVIKAAESQAEAIGLRADAQLHATVKDAEGMNKLQEVEHLRYGGPKALLSLEKMKLKVKMTRALSKAAVPTVQLNATGGANGSDGYPGGGEAAMIGMMKTKGQGFMKAVSKDQSKTSTQS
eukprot:gb/GEZN01000901.1/.p1 GENE.gb/GEZN01000901.1/~~gb/GEZN01000901.1/.p1  ORF type:complete len:987 (+),score=113.70 gb/GEZN01000901.1/:67-3027(+)